MPRRYYSSTAARTTLSASVNSSVTSFSVVAVSGWPASFPYTLIIDQDTVNEEIVEVTNRSGTTLTVVRGVDGTTAVAHSAGAAVNHGVSARDFNEPNQFLNEGGTVTGSTVISSTSGTTLEVRNTGTGNSFVVEDTASPDSTPFVVNASGLVGIGTSNPQRLLHVGAFGGMAMRLENTNVTNSFDTIVIELNAANATRVRLDGQQNGSGSGGTFIARVADESGTVTERMRITSTGNVGIGTSGPAYLLHLAADGSVAQAIQRSSTDNFSGNFFFLKQRGTSSSPTVVAQNDLLGTIQFWGHDGTQTRAAAQIRAEVDGAPGASDMPGRLTFYTTADGGTTQNERMRIDNAGLITGTGTSLGAWTAYTPTLGGTGWAIGNGTATGYYCQIGKIVHFRLEITMGSTSTFGAASALAGLPVAMRNVNTENYFALGRVLDASASSSYPVGARVWDTSTLVVRNMVSPMTDVTSTAPMTWAASDAIRISGAYEAA